MTARADELRAIVAEATPGPWSAFVRNKTIAIDIGRKPTGKRPNVVDWAGFDTTDQPHKTNAANARLIAQAPTLALEAADLHDKLAAMTAENDRLWDALAVAASYLWFAAGEGKL
jgi:hypothetical protein